MGPVALSCHMALDMLCQEMHESWSMLWLPDEPCVKEGRKDVNDWTLNRERKLLRHFSGWRTCSVRRAWKFLFVHGSGNCFFKCFFSGWASISVF